MKIKLPKRVTKNHVEAITLAITAYVQLRDLKTRLDAWKANRGYTVTIVSSDQAYEPVGTAIVKMLPFQHQKQISVLSRRQDSGDMKILEGYAATAPQTMVIEGHEITVSLMRADNLTNKGSDTDIATILSSMKPDELQLWSPTYAGKQAIIRFVERCVDESNRDTPRLFTARSWGDFQEQTDIPLRQLDTVVLRKGVAEDILWDLMNFMAQEQDYLRMGLPWHRGYLLHGCPGSGKTSLVKALASELNLDLYAVSLGSVRDDQTLTNMFMSVQPRSALLIEDIDIAVSARDRDNTTPGVSTSGLLNALDGIGTPHGLITFMTSNRKKSLDAALLRPGRCDRDFKIGYLDDEQLGRLVETFTGKKMILPPVPAKVSPAEIIELYKENLTTPENFQEVLEGLLRTPR